MMTIRVKTVRHQHVIRMKHENLPILNKVYITVYIISCSKPALMFFPFEIIAAIFTFECIKNKTLLFRSVMPYQYCIRLYDILSLGFVRHSVAISLKIRNHYDGNSAEDGWRANNHTEMNHRRSDGPPMVRQTDMKTQ